MSYYNESEDETLRRLDHDTGQEARAKIDQIKWILQADFEAIINPDIVLRKVWLALRGINVEKLLVD
jgi:hypothetical protein